jgi:hypothetical protein
MWETKGKEDAGDDKGGKRWETTREGRGEREGRKA